MTKSNLSGDNVNNLHFMTLKICISDFVYLSEHKLCESHVFAQYLMSLKYKKTGLIHFIMFHTMQMKHFHFV